MVRKVGIFRRILPPVPYSSTVDLNLLSVNVAFRLIFRAGAIPLCDLEVLFPSFVIDFRAGGNYWEKSESGYFACPRHMGNSNLHHG